MTKHDGRIGLSVARFAIALFAVGPATTAIVPVAEGAPLRGNEPQDEGAALDSPDRLYELAAAALGRGETAEALGLATRLVQRRGEPGDLLLLARASLADADRLAASGSGGTRLLLLDAERCARDAADATRAGGGALAAEAANLHAFTLVRLDRAAEATTVLDARLATAPDDPDARALRGWLRLETGDDAGALDDLARAIECEPRRVVPRVHRARVLARSDAAAAAKAFHEIVDLGIDDAALATDVHEILGNAPREAAGVLARLAERHADDPGTWLLLGRARLDMKDDAEALAALDRAHQLAPDDGDALGFRAEARRRTGDTAGYVADLVAIVDAELPAATWAARRLGDAAAWYADAGEWESVRRIAERLVEFEPNVPRHRANLALAVARLGRTGEAEALYRDALLDAPEEGALWNDLGLLLAGDGHGDEAHTAFERAAALGSPDGRENLGVVLLERQAPEQAAEWFRSVLREEPRRLRSLSGLARTLAAGSGTR